MVSILGFWRMARLKGNRSYRERTRARRSTATRTASGSSSSLKLAESRRLELARWAARRRKSTLANQESATRTR